MSKALIYDTQEQKFCAMYSNDLELCTWGEESAAEEFNTLEDAQAAADTLNGQIASQDRFTGTLPGGNPPTKPHG